MQVHAETVGRVEVSSIGGDAVSVTFGDDLSGVRLLGAPGGAQTDSGGKPFQTGVESGRGGRVPR